MINILSPTLAVAIGRLAGHLAFSVPGQVRLLAGESRSHLDKQPWRSRALFVQHKWRYFPRQGQRQSRGDQPPTPGLAQMTMRHPGHTYTHSHISRTILFHHTADITLPSLSLNPSPSRWPIAPLISSSALCLCLAKQLNGDVPPKWTLIIIIVVLFRFQYCYKF